MCPPRIETISPFAMRFAAKSPRPCVPLTRTSVLGDRYDAAIWERLEAERFLGHGFERFTGVHPIGRNLSIRVHRDDAADDRAGGVPVAEPGDRRPHRLLEVAHVAR